MKKQGIDDPIKYYQKEIDELNETNSRKVVQIGEESVKTNLGYFLPKAMFDFLNMDRTLNIIASNYNVQYDFATMFRSLVYAQIVGPGSKLKAFERVIPSLFEHEKYSYDQVLDCVNFIGTDYHKYIEMLNRHIEKQWGRNTNIAYFDCTNYYFEIDLENSFLKKGPSKENRRLPLMGQALMLDADQIPLDTEFYPGNESEKPYIRKRIEEMKDRNNIEGRVIQVADKGLNCARNIYSAFVEANDGYIFSKSIRGKSISDAEKQWIFLKDNDFNKWIEVRDQFGTLIYKYKVAISQDEKGNLRDWDIYSYKCKINVDDQKETSIDVKEKRIVTYNPKLATKQRAEILKEVQKLENYVKYKQVIREELGDASKFVNLIATDENGQKVKIATSINQEKVDEALKYCGYNMIVTSEINANPNEIYKIYHNLWRIEESFRIMKTYLESRPVFLSLKETICGHFLICYFALTIMRLLELKTFKDELTIDELFKFIRNYEVTKNFDTSYINCANASETYLKIKKTLGIKKLGNLYLTRKDIDSILNADIDILPAFGIFP